MPLTVGKNDRPDQGTATPRKEPPTMAAPSWDALIKSIDIPSTLSPNGKQFIDDLRDCIKHDNTGLVLHSLNNDRIAGAAILTKNSTHAIILGLGESYSPTYNQPPTYALGDLTNQLQLSFPGVKVLQGIIQWPEDYDRLQRTAAAIKASLQITARSQWKMELNHKAFEKTDYNPGQEMFITSDMGRINAFIDKFSPHAIPSRADFGFGVIIRDRSNKRKNLMHQDSSGDIQVAVTAYMDFVPIQNDQQSGYPTKFRGVIKVSNVTSAIPHKNLWGLLHPLFVGQFIENRGWWKPYKKDFETRNIGNLVPNTEGGHYKVTSEKEWYDFISQAVPQNEIAIALELDDSRFRIAGTDLLMSNPNLLVEAMNDFYGLTPQNVDELMRSLGMETLPHPFLTSYSEVTGLINDNGRLQDSKEWDYLKMATLLKDPGLIQEFFYRSGSDPFARHALLEAKGLEGKLVGTCTSLVSNPAFANWACHLLLNTNLGKSIEYEYNEQVNMFHNGVNLQGAGGYTGHGGMLHSNNLPNYQQGGSPYSL